MAEGLHRIRVDSPRGVAALTKIYLDDVELRGVGSFKFEIAGQGMTAVTLQLYADFEFVGEAAIIKEWRNARPPFWRRLWDRRPMRPSKAVRVRVPHG